MSERRIVLLAALCVALFPTGARASSPPAEALDPSLRLGNVGIPVIVNGQTVNYLFLTIKVNLTPRADQNKLREIEPYFRDAMVRAASRTNFARADKLDTLDEPRFKSAMMAEFTKIAGPGTIKSIEVLMQNPRQRMTRAPT